MAAGEYVKIVEKVMEAFGGMRRICGVASDSAKACVNARKALSKKYPGLVGIQDQAHVVDLLMKDFGKLPFIKEIIDQVNLVVTETRGKRKLLSFVRDEVRIANKSIRQEERNSQQTNAPTSEDPFHPSRLFPPLRRTAVMLRKPARTRFASISDTFEAFIRTRDVLGKVIMDPQFERNLFTADNSEQRQKRNHYKSIISNPHFLEQVKEVHQVFRLCRRYLREFDKETGTSAADVVGFTDFLEKALHHVPTSNCLLTAERMAVIKSRFKKRKDGPINNRSIQVRLIEDIHVAAALLHPTKCPSDFQCHHPRFYAFVKRWVISAVLPSPQSEEREEESSDDEEVTHDDTGEPTAPRESTSGLQSARNTMIGNIMRAYEAIHSRWMRMPNPTSSEGTNNRGVERIHDEYAYRCCPLRFWTEEMRVGSCPELCELALRTLSISPSSCAAERSFSAQSRIRTPSRNRLGSDVVRMLMFLRWNLKYYDESLLGTSSSGQRVSRIQGPEHPETESDEDETTSSSSEEETEEPDDSDEEGNDSA